MKKVMLLAVLLLSGCAGPKYYSWSSDVGKRCFYSCESSMWSCKASCGPSIPCNVSCDRAADYCRVACPDLREVAELPK